MGAEHLAAYRKKNKKKKGFHKQKGKIPTSLLVHQKKKELQDTEDQLKNVSKNAPININWVISKLGALHEDLSKRKKTESMRTNVLRTIVYAIQTKEKFANTEVAAEELLDMEKFKAHASETIKSDTLSTETAVH